MNVMDKYLGVIPRWLGNHGWVFICGIFAGILINIAATLIKEGSVGTGACAIAGASVWFVNSYAWRQK